MLGGASASRIPGAQPHFRFRIAKQPAQVGEPWHNREYYPQSGLTDELTQKIQVDHGAKGQSPSTEQGSLWSPREHDCRTSQRGGSVNSWESQ